MPFLCGGNKENSPMFEKKEEFENLQCQGSAKNFT